MTGPQATQYKMIFCDIDGTLLNSKNQIPAETRRKIQELYRIGVPFVLASARMPSGIWPLQSELEIKAPMICYSGALILDERGDCVKSVGIDREKAVCIGAFIEKEWQRVSCNAYCHNDWIVDDVHDKWVVQEQRITASAPAEGDITDFVPPGGHVHKFLCMGEAGQITGLHDALRVKYPELSVYRSKDTYLEVMDGTVSKANAVACLCAHYGISVEATVSFGDHYNDVDMLLATGAGFAMGNAPDAVKSQARHVTLDNDHEGVLAGLRQLNFRGTSSQSD